MSTFLTFLFPAFRSPVSRIVFSTTLAQTNDTTVENSRNNPAHGFV